MAGSSRGFGSSEGGIKAFLKGDSLVVRAAIFLVMLGAFYLYLQSNEVSHPGAQLVDSTATGAQEQLEDSTKSAPAATPAEPRK